jgi:hypothetical protein
MDSLCTCRSCAPVRIALSRAYLSGTNPAAAADADAAAAACLLLAARCR